MAVVSGVLCVATVGMWVRTSSSADVWCLSKMPTHFAILSLDGHLSFRWLFSSDPVIKLPPENLYRFRHFPGISSISFDYTQTLPTDSYHGPRNGFLAGSVVVWRGGHPLDF